MPPSVKRSRLVNRNVVTAACRTSIRLEPEFWRALDQICEREQVTRNQLVRRVKSAAPDTLLTSAVRVFILKYFCTHPHELSDAASMRSTFVP